MTEYQSSFFKKLFEVDQRMIERIHASQTSMVERVEEGSMSAEFKEILKVITGKQEVDNFTGSQAKKLLKQLKIKEKEKNQHEDTL
jgi:hypothetical protein